MTRNEMPDNCRHSVYRRRVVSTEFNFGGKERRTLGIEKDCVPLEMWPLEHTPQLRDVLSSVGGHCADPVSACSDCIHPTSDTYIAYRHR